jgi:hypothetical protein
MLMSVWLLLLAGLASAESKARSVVRSGGSWDPRVPHITQYSRELGWSLIPGAGDIGENGWRRPCYPRAKASGHYRILCLGDSTTFGMNCSWENAWPHQLESLLRSDPDWSKAHGVTEVLNLGVLTYGPDQSLLALKQSGLSYAPDLVIFHLAIDDFADVSVDHNWKWKAENGATFSKPFFVLREGRLVLARDHAPLPTDASGKVVKVPKQILGEFQLFLFMYLRGLVHSQSQAEAQSPSPQPTNAQWPIHDVWRAKYAQARPLVWALIKEMSRTCAEAGVDFAVTLSPAHMVCAKDDPPWRVASFLREYHQDSKAVGVVAMECVSDYFQEGANEDLLAANSCYLNPQGNALIARTTWRWLKQRESKGKRTSE